MYHQQNRPCTFFLTVGLVVGLLSVVSPSVQGDIAPPENRLTIENQAINSLLFTPNQGQFDEDVLYRAETRGATVWLTPAAVYYHVVTPLDPVPVTDPHRPWREFEDPGGEQVVHQVVRMQLVDAAAAPSVRAFYPANSVSNFFLGADPEAWVTNVPGFREVVYQSVYPGIDVRYRGTVGQLEYDFEVSPHSDPSNIAVRFDGIDSMHVEQDGSLSVYTPFGLLVKYPPISYQTDGEQHLPRSGSYILLDNKTFGFLLGSDYDPALPLVIDPVLAFSTYLGGTGSDQARAVAVDSDSAIYLAGHTSSLDFPVADPFDTTFNDSGTGYRDAFVVKLSGAGDSLEFSTYLGGTNANDKAFAIQVDGSGAVYVSGSTSANDFPVLNALQDSLAGAQEVFVSKLAPTGNLLEWSTYLGGTESDGNGGLALDDAGRPYITGYTSSPDFPTSAPYDDALDGSHDAFVARFSADGSVLEYCTYLGGTDPDFAVDIAIAENRSAVIAGYTASGNFPVANAWDDTFAGGTAFGDAFVTKFDSTGGSLVFSTFLGGGGDDFALALDTDPQGNAFIAGYTFSATFPTINALQPTYMGIYMGFVTKLMMAGDSVGYSTFLGGGADDIVTCIAVDELGGAHVAGNTGSLNFPIINPIIGSHGGNMDAFASMISTNGDTLVFSTFLGGIYFEFAYGMATDAARNSYVVGYTDSPNFPLENPYQDSLASGYDLFISKIALEAYNCVDSDLDGYGDPGHPDNDCPDDNCPDNYNPDQEDLDSDGLGDSCDNCFETYNADQEDTDLDGIGDSCDTCTDLDGDSFGDPGFPYTTCEIDNCPDDPNPGQEDADNDGVGDLCDECTDTDGDGYADPGYPATTCLEDNCPSIANPAQEDTDSDGLGDSCDICPGVYDPDQGDLDGDGIGDSCDTCTDYDDDGYGNPGFPANTCDEDNCPYTYNPLQTDADSNGTGDACDQGCCIEPTTGNVDFDPLDEITITDLIYLVSYMFQSGPPPPCPEEANIIGPAGLPIDVEDLVHLVQFMFTSGPPPADCPQASPPRDQNKRHHIQK